MGKVRLCSVEGCSNKHFGHSLCWKHYDRVRRHGSIELPMRVIPLCTVDGCGEKVYGNGMCNKHYKRVRRTGTLDVRMRPAGSGSINPQGYKRVTTKTTRKAEHILVAERAFGSPLPKGAIVHHVDEDPSNNDPSNLVICENLAYHVLLHRRKRAYEATGDPNTRRCYLCGEHSDPLDMALAGKGHYCHRRCLAEKARLQRKRAKRKGDENWER